MTDRLEMARQALAQAEKDTENWPGPCHECVHWKAYLSLGGVSEWDHCTNDLARLKTFTAHGGYDSKLPDCRDVRGRFGLCGPEGKLFEPKLSTKIKAKGFWATLFGK